MTQKTVYEIKKYFLYFMVYSVIGWIYEEFLEVFIYGRGITDRGILIGPYCPVYGVGTLLFLFTVYFIIKNKPIKSKILLLPAVFILCALIATAVELIASYLCEDTIGYIPWDYTMYKYSFQARIALSTSIRFGLGGTLFLYVIQPFLEAFLEKIKRRTLCILFYGAAIIFAVDCLVFAAKVVL